MGHTELYAHKYYVSTVSTSVSGDTLHIQISVFFDDMEAVLYEKTKRFLRMCPVRENKRHELIQLVSWYVDSTFSVSCDGRPLDVLLWHYDCGQESAALYLYTVLPADATEVELSDRMLMDMFPEQRNIIQHHSRNGDRSSVLLSRGREQTRLKI